MPRTGFTPTEHGFHFTNAFTNYFLPGITTRGRCGGMSYGALDHFFNNAPIPASQRLVVRGVDVSARGPDRLDVFARDTNDTVRHRHFFRNGWSDWIPIGGVISSAPSSVSWGDGRIDVFARGQNNALWHTSWDGRNWSVWEDLGGELASGPDVCSWGPGRLDVFARGMDNALWHKSYERQWSEWESLGGVLSSDPSAVSWSIGRIDVFARGMDNALWHKSYERQWSEWESLGGTITSSPDACSWGRNRLDVFARGNDNALWQKTWDGTRWSQWTSIGGVFSGDPAVASWGSGRIDVLGIGADQQLWHASFSEGHWSVWGALVYEVPGDGTPLGDYLYRRQVTSLVNQGPGFVGRLHPFLPGGDAERFGWGIREQDELGRLRRSIDRGTPVPVGLISVRAGIDVHHQAVAVGYDQGSRVEDLRIYLYDPNYPDAEITLTPDPPGNQFKARVTGGDQVRDLWRTYFVDEAYRPVVPLN